MTRDEAKRIIRIIAATYPNYYKTQQRLSDAVDVWAMIFAHDSADIVNAALAVYMSRSNEFAPTPGQLKDIIYRELNRDEPSEIEAWNMVAKAIRNGTYGAEEEFEKLPDSVKKAIGSPSYLRDLAITEDLNVSVESSNFFKRYRVIVERKKEEALMPAAIRELLTSKKLIEG